jgi:hypothetical protein
MGRKLAASTVVTNPNTGAPTVIEAGAEVPDWATDLIEDHLYESEADPRQVAEDADVDDNAKPALALAEEAGTVPVGVNPTSVEPADAGQPVVTGAGVETVSAPDEEKSDEEPSGPAEQTADGGSPAEEPKKTAARRRKAADKGENQSDPE